MGRSRCWCNELQAGGKVVACLLLAVHRVRIAVQGEQSFDRVACRHHVWAEDAAHEPMLTTTLVLGSEHHTHSVGKLGA